MSRLAEILEGLRGPDAWYWRDVAERRIHCLDEDEPMFGLVPHELQERAALKRALASQQPAAGEGESA